MTCGDIDTRESTEDGAIASALKSDADIPPASSDFPRRCRAAAARSFRDGPGRARGASKFKFAVCVAAVSSLATWMATVSAVSTGSRPSAAQRNQNAAAIEDISVFGVDTCVSAHSAIATRGGAAAVSMSNESVVNADPYATALWKTLNAGQTQMAWEWPERARSARLTITGGGLVAEKVYAKSDAFPVWNPPVPDDFCEDDVFTARLTFYNGERGGGDEVACLVAEGIGFVRGVSGEGGRLALERAAMFQIVKK